MTDGLTKLLNVLQLGNKEVSTMTKWHIRNRVKNAVRRFVDRKRSQVRIANRQVQLALQNRQGFLTYRLKMPKWQRWNHEI